MSSLDRLRSFAESREPDHAIIRAGFTYGDARMLFTGIECMKAELEEAEQQRDAARLELRALEWLCDWCSWNEGSVIVDGGNKVLRVLAGPQCASWPEERARALTYAALARSEGWNG